MNTELYIRINRSIVGPRVAYIRQPHYKRIYSTLDNRDKIKSLVPINDLFVLYGYAGVIDNKISNVSRVEVNWKKDALGYAQYNVEHDGMARLQKVSLDGEIYTDKNHSHPDLWAFFDYDFPANDLNKIIEDNNGHAKVFWKADRYIYISHDNVWIREVKEYKQWKCNQCGRKNNWDNLFCSNYPGPSEERWEGYCTGTHPDYWELTKDWPSHKNIPRNSTYYWQSSLY